MIRYLRGRRSKSITRKIQLNKDFFNFTKTVSHGFPRYPTCIAYDQKLSLFAIGTRKGSLRVYGKPSVEFEGSIEDESEIRQIAFIQGIGKLVVLTVDSSLLLYKITTEETEKSERSYLECVSTNNFFTKDQDQNTLKQITTFTIAENNDFIFLGTNGGDIYKLSLETFKPLEQIINQADVIKNVPSDFRKNNPGEVEAILQKPQESEKILIGYSRGLIVLWDDKNLTSDHFYVSDQALESICWKRDGEHFVSSHNDGSVFTWTTDSKSENKKQSEDYFGPYPCKAINKIITKSTGKSEELLIFSDGLPRPSYQGKNSLSLIKKKINSTQHHCLDFPSKLIDFVVIDEWQDKSEYDKPVALMVLTEEEIIGLDLNTPEWLQFQLPYLSSIHYSPITCVQYCPNIPQDIYDKLKEAGEKQSFKKFSPNPWPITGGEVKEDSEKSDDILVTGHENGEVNFWYSGGVCLKHIYTLQSSKLFVPPEEDDIIAIDSDEPPVNESKKLEDSWPPFRKVGMFDPYSDDPQMHIRKIAFCPLSGVLIAAGAAGQVMVFSMKEENNFTSVRLEEMHILKENEMANLKGFRKLIPKIENAKFPGFQMNALIQILPASSVTSLCLNSEWGLFAVGTALGFGLYDLIQFKEVFCKTTHDGAISGDAETLMPRRKSFKKSLRESFRRLKRGRSQRVGNKKLEGSSPSPTPASPTRAFGERAKIRATVNEINSSDIKPVERRIEARPTDDIEASVVKYVYMGIANIAKKSLIPSPTLWAGTQGGVVYNLSFNIPGLKTKDEDLRKKEAVSPVNLRSIHLAHKAPVVFIHLIDNNGIPTQNQIIEDLKKSVPVADKVLICTEEQFILYNLPQLKHHLKFKLTADQGLQARRISLASFSSKTDDTIKHCILCLSNHGDVGVFNISDLTQEMKVECTKKEDVNGISSLVFTSYGEGLYLQAPSEFRRFTLSATKIVQARCSLAIESNS